MSPNNPKDGKKGLGLDAENKASKLSLGKSWFFGIGINQYAHFPPLNNAVKDVKDLLILLQDQYGFDPDLVISIFDKEATRENIIDELDALVEKIGPEDKLLIYFSGHGHLNPKTNLAYWIPQDAREDRTYGYISNSTVRDYIKAIPSLHTLLISDTCFSGTLFVRGTSRSGDAAEELELRRSRWGIVSGRHDEQVYDGEPGTNSPFAASILNVLSQNRESKLNVARFADRVVEMTRSNYQQLPEGNPLFGVGHNGGQYMFRLAAGESNLWEHCRAGHSLAAYNAYLDQFPKGTHADEALQRIRELEEESAWQEAEHIGKIYGYRTFLRSFSAGKYSGKARQRIWQLQEADLEEERNFWGTAKAQDTIDSYTAYLNRFFTGQFVVQARNRIKELERLAEAAALEGKIEQTWQQAQALDTLAGYKAFIRQYPEHRYAKTARHIIDQQQERSDREEQPVEEKTSQPQKTDSPQLQKATTPMTQYRPYVAGILLLAIFLIWKFGFLGGKTYPTIQFKTSGLTWMAQNLNYKIPDSWYHDKIKYSDRSKYGRLYTWEAANKACQAIGWRLPTDQEWREMAQDFGGADDDASDGGKAAYEALLAGGSTGFSAQLGGYRGSPDSFHDLGDRGTYWSATEYNSNRAWYYGFYRSSRTLERNFFFKGVGRSCRCVQD